MPTLSTEDYSYVRTAIYLALGALKVLSKDESRVGEIIRHLEVASEKLEKGKATQPAKANGGHARAEALTPERRREIAKDAAKRRWGKRQ